MSWILQCILSPDFTEKTVHSEYLFILLRETKQDLLVTIMHISNEIQWSLCLFHFVQCVTQKSSLKSKKKNFHIHKHISGRWEDRQMEGLTWFLLLPWCVACRIKTGSGGVCCHNARGRVRNKKSNPDGVAGGIWRTVRTSSSALWQQTPTDRS